MSGPELVSFHWANGVKLGLMGGLLLYEIRASKAEKLKLQQPYLCCPKMQKLNLGEPELRRKMHS